MIELLPCPFCGTTPVVSDPSFCRPQGRRIEDREGVKQLWSANCSEDRGGCTASVLGYSRDEAISEWQRRPEISKSKSHEESSNLQIVISCVWVLLWVAGAVMAKGFWSTFFAIMTGGIWSLYLIVEFVLSSQGIIS